MEINLKGCKPRVTYEHGSMFTMLEKYKGQMTIVQKTDLKLHHVKLANGKFKISVPKPKVSVEIGKSPMEILPAYVKPEIMGTTLSGLISLSVAIYAFAIGQLGIGIALLGPFFASILGCFFLIFLSRKIELKE